MELGFFGVSRGEHGWIACCQPEIVLKKEKASSLEEANSLTPHTYDTNITCLPAPLSCSRRASPHDHAELFF